MVVPESGAIMHTVSGLQDAKETACWHFGIRILITAQGPNGPFPAGMSQDLMRCGLCGDASENVYRKKSDDSLEGYKHKG
ncbi:hypothetical protein ASZ90_016212 [hydrocarbon metagenome]|uniref:Uncharacterized protein n=1 Tax=hydrocarbon metagenome TaxID=938273 RepID=A0A0W8EZX8_9ZZZZ